MPKLLLAIFVLLLALSWAQLFSNVKCRFFYIISLSILFLGISSLNAQNRLRLIWEVDSLIDKENYDLALEKLEKVIDSDSAQFKGLGFQLKGVIYGGQGLDSLALDMFDLAEEYIPHYADIYASRASFYLDRLEYEMALKDYIKALKQVDDLYDSVYIANLMMDTGLTLKLLNQNDRASMMLDESLNFRKDNWRTYYHKADILYIKGDFERAMQNINVAESLVGGLNNDVFFIKAGIMHWMGESEKALTLAKSIEGKTGKPYSLSMLIGDIYQAIGESENALEYFKKSLEIFPEEIGALNNVAFMNMKLGRYEEATFFLDKAIELGPHQPFPYNNKASCFYHLGYHQEALSLVDKSLSLNSDNSWAYINRAKIYFALDMKTKACADVETANKLLHPEKEELDALIERCKK